MQMNSFAGKELLSLVRRGDYAHAGEEEAIELALRTYARRPGRLVLDAGCGRGGTAWYVQDRGWGTVVGIDREPGSVARARRVYPGVEFHACDVLDVPAVVGRKFDLIYLFNSFYAFADQPGALAALAEVSRESGRLVLFDYVDRGGFDPEGLLADDGPLVPHPIRPGTIGWVLAEAGWHTVEVEDLTGVYERWYDSLVRRIDARRAEIIRLAGIDAFESMWRQYAGLLAAIRKGTLGGAIIHAKRGPGV
jgi:SAM-dependent methyltransferase